MVVLRYFGVVSRVKGCGDHIVRNVVSRELGGSPQFSQPPTSLHLKCFQFRHSVLFNFHEPLWDGFLKATKGRHLTRTKNAQNALIFILTYYFQTSNVYFFTATWETFHFFLILGLTLLGVILLFSVHAPSPT